MESKSLWIFCCGAKRSGSTLQYNLLAGIVEKAGVGRRIEYGEATSFPELKEKYKDEPGYKVFKVHSLTDEIKAEITEYNAAAFYAYRDIRDVVLSSVNKKWIPRTSDALKSTAASYVAEFNKWMQIKERLFISKYELFYDQLEAECEKICRLLKVSMDASQLKELAAEMSLDNLKVKQREQTTDLVEVKNQVFDRKTLLHTNHIHSGKVNQFLEGFTAEEIVLIESVAQNWLVNQGYSLYWPTTKYFVSSSQHLDDYMTYIMLDKKPKGLVVEVGAFDGVHLSNSYSLEQVGWKSLCIEPNPEFYSVLIQQRPHSININKAVVSNDFKKTEVEFYAEDIGVLSGVVIDEEDIKNRYSRRGLEYVAPKKISVPAAPLTTILSSAGIKEDQIDVMSIDVEGLELEVLQGLDITRFKPKVLVIEANSPVAAEKVKQYLCSGNEYNLVVKNHQNLFFVHKTVRPNLNFDFANAVQAVQYHPKGAAYTIQSIAPKYEILTASGNNKEVNTGFFKRLFGGK